MYACFCLSLLIYFSCKGALEAGIVKKQILTGADSFEKIIEGDYFYVDKTLFIKELLENRGEVTLMTRPRRFGKTLNMSMLKSFFEIGKDGKGLFDGLEIMGHGDITVGGCREKNITDWN